MPKESEVLDYIRGALAKPLVSAEELSMKHRFKTPLDWFRKQPHDWHIEYTRRPHIYRDTRDPIKTELSALIKRAFGHFAANPSRAGNVIAHQRTYVYAGGDEEYQDPAFPLPVNWNTKSADDFVRSLAEAATKARKLYEERYYPARSTQQDLSTEKLHQSSLTKWALLGDRGVGKTAFLNHILATRTQQLHRNRVIWVRIDLTKEYDDRLSLEKIIQWQTLQILFRYYDQTTRNEDIHKAGSTSEAVGHWIDKMNNELVFDLSGDNKDLFRYARSVVGQANLTVDVFRSVLASARVTFATNETATDLSDPWIFRAIWDYLTVGQNVSFLIIVDGLDQLGLSTKDKKRFERWHGSVYTTLFQEATLAAAFLVTMRYQTWSNELTDDRFQRGFQLASVAPVPSKLIWDRKLLYLKDKAAFEKNWQTASLLDATSYGDFIEAFCTAFMEFASYSLSAGIKDTQPSTDITAGFSRLDQIFGNNRRKVFEALTSTVEFFVRIMPDAFDRLMNDLVARSGAAEIGGRVRLTGEVLPNLSRYQYLFIESLMLEDPGRTLREARYSMVAASNEEPTHFHSNGKQDFLFNVFAAPFIRGAEKYVMLLYGLRLIQLFDAEGSSIDKDEAIQFFVECFGYDEEILLYTFDELMDAGVLSYLPVAELTFPDTIELTDRGRYVLRRLIKSVEYINLALQAAPLPAYLIDRGLFPIRRYNCAEYVLHNKIISTINFVRFLKQIEGQEEELFNRTLGAASHFSYREYKAGSFLFSGDVEENVFSAIEHMVSRAWNAGGPRKKEFEMLVDDDLLGVA